MHSIYMPKENIIFLKTIATFATYSNNITALSSAQKQAIAMCNNALKST